MRARHPSLAGMSASKVPPVGYAFITIALEAIIILCLRVVQGQLTVENSLLPTIGLLFGILVVLFLYVFASDSAVLDRAPAPPAPPNVAHNPPPVQEEHSPPEPVAEEPVYLPPLIALPQLPRPEVKKRQVSNPGAPVVKIAQGFIFPKEGNNPDRSEDKFDMNPSMARYAVADGAARSFLPAEWAKIVAHNFVMERPDLTDRCDLITWLEKCRDQWLQFVQDWVQDAQKKNPNKDFGSSIRRGPQTTLIGCSIFSLTDKAVRIEVLAMGDAHFFLVRQPCTNQWQYESFPYTSPEQFNSFPETFGASPGRIETASEDLKIPPPYIASRGDVIVLTSDELAKWILSQPGDDATTWYDLFAIDSNEKLRNFVEPKLEDGEMRLDDVTLLIIPL